MLQVVLVTALVFAVGIVEANHQPKAVLRSAALEAGLNLDAFPRATTMAVTDARVEVSRAAQEAYELVHSA